MFLEIGPVEVCSILDVAHNRINVFLRLMLLSLQKKCLVRLCTD